MNHWQKYHSRWSLIEPPLRPDPDVIRYFQSFIGPQTQPALLLGVTPELADAFDVVTAVDKNPAMIANVWPGNSGTKTAREGNWLELAEPDESFAAIIGDGSLNNLAWVDEIEQLLKRVLAMLKPGSRFACRLFERPGTGYSQRHLLRVASEPATMNFHAFKWQLAMHIAEEKGANVPVASILQKFNELLPDRDALADTTGWRRMTIDTIDVYQGSPIVYSFPNRSEFISAIPPTAKDVQFQHCGTYDMAECCPILTFRKPD